MYINEQIAAPLVSVIMPAYNAEAFIIEAILSVVNQTVKNWELIVIDDCSSDRTYKMAQMHALADPRIRVLRNEKNAGVAKTRNRGIDLSRGHYVAFLDSDDVWYPEKLERQIKKMEDENADIGFCSYEIIGATGTKVRADYIVPEQARFEDILKENFIQCSSMLIRSQIVKKYRFNTEFFHEDYVLGLDILKNGHMAAGCKEVLLAWRYIENSRSFNKWKAAKNRWRIYTEYLNLPLGKSLYLFVCYAAAGVQKYFWKN